MNSVNKNAMFNTVKTVFGIIYPLITFPYISRVLMAENVGKINFVCSIISYFSLLASLGVSTYAIRECSKVRDNIEKLDSLSSQIFSMNIISTLIAYVALAITLVVARPLDNYRILICIQSATILFTTLGADWINSVMEDFKFITVRTVGMQLVSLFLMFVFVHKPNDYITYVIISVVASSGANIINIFYRSRFCKTRFTLSIDWKRHLPPIMLLFSLVLAQTIYCNSDITMLGLIKNDREVGLYSLSVRIYTLVNQVVSSVAFVVMPQLSLNFTNNNYRKVNELLRYSLNFIIVLGLPCIVGLNVITKSIIGTLGGSEYAGSATSLHILTMSLACSFISGWIGNMMMIPSGRENISLKSSVISASLNVVLNLFIIPIFGLNGAAFTTFLAEFCGIIVKVPHIDKRIKIERLFEMVKGPLFGSIFIFFVGIVSSSLISSDLIIVIVSITIGAIGYGIILFILKDEFVVSYFAPIIDKMKRRK